MCIYLYIYIPSYQRILEGFLRIVVPWGSRTGFMFCFLCSELQCGFAFRLAGWLAGWQAGRQAGRQAGGRAGRQKDTQAGRETGRQTDRTRCQIRGTASTKHGR